MVTPKRITLDQISRHVAEARGISQRKARRYVLEAATRFLIPADLTTVLDDPKRVQAVFHQALELSFQN